jgi:hypothetical protein
MLFVQAVDVNLNETSARRLRTFGLVWIVLAPILVLMASMSTVSSDVTYAIQVAVFSSVAAAALLFGAAAVMRQAWSTIGLLVLSWLGAAYFVGSALVILVWPSMLEPAWRLGVAFIVAPWGIPFVIMARAMRRLISSVGPGAVPSSM